MNPFDLLPCRIASQIEVEPDDGCWIWRGAGHPYGNVSWKGSFAKIHRVVLHVMDPDVAINPGRSGDDVDHLCGVKRCVNPLHLEVTTHLENVRRGHETRKPSAA